MDTSATNATYGRSPLPMILANWRERLPGRPEGHNRAMNEMISSRGYA
jgi:hypothetical protein